MPEVDWDNVIIPRNVPVTLICYNDDSAHIECGICGEGVAWTEDGASSRTMAFGDIAAAFTVHVDGVHSG